MKNIARQEVSCNIQGRHEPKSQTATLAPHDRWLFLSASFEVFRRRLRRCYPILSKEITDLAWYANDVVRAPQSRTESEAATKAAMIAALRTGGELGCTLQDLCKATRSSIETIALLAWELDEAGWLLHVGFDEDGIVWLAVWSDTDDATARHAGDAR